MKTTFAILLSVFLMSPVLAQMVHSEEKVEYVTVVNPKPYAISHNIVFVIDSSSTLNRRPDMVRKFKIAWDTITEKFARDELYVRFYTFNDRLMERRTKWINAGGLNGAKVFQNGKKWVLNNTGMFSWGVKALRMAMRDKNPLDKNKLSSKRLTVVIITDGGFTEAANGRYHYKDVLAGKYLRTGSFEVIKQAIQMEQVTRKVKGLEFASICTVGIENKDPQWNTSVKRPDKECQKFLKMVGIKYGGGYILIRNKK